MPFVPTIRTLCQFFLRESLSALSPAPPFDSLFFRSSVQFLPDCCSIASQNEAVGAPRLPLKEQVFIDDVSSLVDEQEHRALLALRYLDCLLQGLLSCEPFLTHGFLSLFAIVHHRPVFQRFVRGHAICGWLLHNPKLEPGALLLYRPFASFPITRSLKRPEAFSS